jgi:RNA polymerase sigma-70 factor, ECF subfamily
MQHADEGPAVQPDSVLVDRVKQGDVPAYEQLVVRYQRVAIVVALRVLKDRQQAEDVVQESFVIAYRHFASLRDGSKFGPWLTRITKREAVRAARKRRPVVSIGPTTKLAAPELESAPKGHESLIELLNRLPAHERVVVTLHHLEGQAASEIAEMTGRPVGTVTKQLSRAMQRLRQWAYRQEG